MKKRLFIILLLLILAVALLLFLNAAFGANLSIIWVQTPELGMALTFRNLGADQPERRNIPDRLANNTYSKLTYKQLDRDYLERKYETYFPDSNKSVKTSKHQQVDQCAIFKDEEKFDCFPENIVTEEGCLNRGCCWVPTSARKMPLHSPDPMSPLAPTDVPYCFYPKNFSGYSVVDQDDTLLGFKADLKRSTRTYYGGDVKHLIVDVRYETDTRLHVKIYDADHTRYEVPLSVPIAQSRASDPQYFANMSDTGDVFELAVMRADDGTVLLNTKNAAAFIYSDQFLQFSYFLPSTHIYGLGEHRDTLLHSLNWTKLTMWTRDLPPTENENLYGAHPFYLMMEPSGKCHGFFLLNSNAMDVILQPAPAITWRVIGGILDFYVLLGPTPSDVISQYTQVIGRTFMPPYWSLGFHICRNGYKTANRTLEIVDRVRKAGVPQDVQWNDIDYTVSQRDFTTDPKNFGDQPALVKTLHDRGMHYVIITDPGISSTQPPGTYPPYDVGKNMSIFITGVDGDPLVGKVWPGDTVFPDFSNPSSQLYWTMMVKNFHGEVNFDGLWIDMNEISNFIEGSVTGCPINMYEYPPYTPGVYQNFLHARTICASAKQNFSSHYNLHNMYGLMETNATYQALKYVRQKRPFVISRSTYPGQGQYGGHWSGDNRATYHDLYMSIPEILNFNMFGISMVGADICGFGGETTAQLCQRWYQLGAFYPFSRSHNCLNCKQEQDPAAFGEAVANSTRKVYLTRYSLLPYLYTLFHKSHVLGETVARPLFFEFPSDPVSAYIDQQFLWGPALMISPVLNENMTSVAVYFPDAVWYDFYTGQRISITMKYISLYTPMDKINLHVRGGYILPMQEPALTTTQSRKNKFSLLVALDKQNRSKGEIFLDDGDTIGTYESGNYTAISFTASMGIVTSQVEHLGYNVPMTLGNVTVFGIPKFPVNVELNNVKQNYTYNVVNKVLYVAGLSVNFLQNFKLTWT